MNVSVVSLQNINDIVSQIKEENVNKESSDSENNKPSLKDEIEKTKDKLTREEYKKVNSEYEQMLDHIKKLEEYKANPYKFDNKNFLQNAPNDQIRQKIIQTRISHLEKEILTFYNNIIKTICK